MKNLAKDIMFAVLLGLCAPLAARAQEINFGALQEAEPNRVHLRTGAEHGFVLGVGYSRTVPLFDRMLVLTGDLTLPWAELDVADYRARAGFMLPLIGPERWKLAGGIAATLRGTDNELGRMTNVGADFAFAGGYYAPRWFAAGEFGFDWAATTYVDHHEEYREIVYEDAEDGWYLSPGANIRAGLQGGLSLGRYDVILRAGMVRDITGEPPLLPFYGTLEMAMRF
jgi:hypothetical protein